MKTKTAIFLMIVGIAVALYPFLDRTYNFYQEKKLISEWEKTGYAANPEKEAAENYKELNQVFAAPTDTAASGKETTNPDSTIQKTSSKTLVGNSTDNKPERDGLLGIIEIKKIGVKLPILEGASLKNMKIAAGHITGTAFPGEAGNAAIAAHRSWTYGKMFNRLNEVKNGDEIVIQDKGHLYKYRVFNRMVVKPSNTSVLVGKPSERRLTLITCTPLKTATHRLIIQAELEKS